MKHKKEGTTCKNTMRTRTVNRSTASTTDSDASSISPKSDRSGSEDKSDIFNSGHQSIVNRLMAHSQYTIPQSVVNCRVEPVLQKSGYQAVNKYTPYTTNRPTANRNPPQYECYKPEINNNFSPQNNYDFIPRSVAGDELPRNVNLFTEYEHQAEFDQYCGQLAGKVSQYQDYQPKSLEEFNNALASQFESFAKNADYGFTSELDNYRADFDYNDSLSIFTRVNDTLLEEQSKYSNVSSPSNFSETIGATAEIESSEYCPAKPVAEKPSVTISWGSGVNATKKPIKVSGSPNLVNL
jgi:hypothetical protein